MHATIYKKYPVRRPVNSKREHRAQFPKTLNNSGTNPPDSNNSNFASIGEKNIEIIFSEVAIGSGMY